MIVNRRSWDAPLPLLSLYLSTLLFIFCLCPCYCCYHKMLPAVPHRQLSFFRMPHPYVLSQEGLQCLKSETAGQGCRRAWTQQQDCCLHLSAKRNRRSTSRVWQKSPPGANHLHVSEETVTSRLREGVVRAQRPLAGPVFTDKHRAAQLAFTHEHQNWQVCQWHPVLLADESKFTYSACDRSERVWRHRNKCCDDCNIRTGHQCDLHQTKWIHSGLCFLTEQNDPEV